MKTFLWLMYGRKTRREKLLSMFHFVIGFILALLIANYLGILVFPTN